MLISCLVKCPGDVVPWNKLISGFNRSGGELLDRMFFMEVACWKSCNVVQVGI